MAATDDVEQRKRAAALHAAAEIHDGMRVGLGTGSTVAYLVPAVAARGLSIRCVATSVRTEDAARSLGLDVESFDGPGALDRLDLAIDGADQVDDAGWVVKGGGGAHTREKRVAAAADRVLIIVDDGKLVDRVHTPIPLELMAFGLAATMRDLGSATLRDMARTPDAGLIADLHGALDDPALLASRLDATPGVVAHGLFAPSMISEVFIGVVSGDVERREITAP